LYDADGRLETIAQGPRTATRGYRPDGFLDSITDPLDQVEIYTPDVVGRVLEVLRPDGETVAFDYDAAGNVESVTPPGRPAHGFGYTPVDQRSLYDPPLLAGGPTPTSWGYDADRKLAMETRPGGGTVTYVPDAAGRLSAITFPGGQVTRSYDPATGKLTGLSGPGGVVLAFGYDGHLLTDLSWSGTISGTLQKAYNNDLRVSTETVNGTHAVGLAYDDDGLLTNAGPLALTRDPQNGRLTGLTVGSVVEMLTPNGFGEVAHRVVTAGASTLFEVNIVQRDALGRILEKTETITGETHTHEYIYDLAGRLSDVYRDGALAAHYDYDPNGNRIGLTTPVGTVSGVPDDQDRLQTYGALSFNYQDSGELQSRMDTATGETTVYSYDPLGNLRQVTLPGGTLIEYEVDGRGRRVGKRVNGAPVKGWLYSDTLRPAAELDGSGAVLARFVYGERVNVPEVMIKGGIAYRMVSDHLGSVRLVVDAATGAVAQRIDYDEFGRVLLDTSPGFQPFGFAGGLYDPDTGLVRFGARDYDPEVGRWTAKDPLLFEGDDTNLYAYALGDPVNRVDPTGRYAQILVLVGAEIFGTALIVTGVVGLCLWMASSIDDDLVDGFPPVWPGNDNDCKYAGEVVVHDEKTCYYACRLGMRKIETFAVWPCPRNVLFD
jgi:RHS repeat-associated protein